jgi:hypothetical protein
MKPQTISVTVARSAGEWIATAYVGGKYAASCACKSKKYAVETARKDAADFAARVLTTPAPAAAAPGQPAGRQGGAVKVGSFGLYLARPWSSTIIREVAEAPRQLATAEPLAA